MFVTTILDWLFPPLCVHCRCEGNWLCPTAVQLLEQEKVLVDPLLIPSVDRIIVRGSYDCEPLAQLVQRLKYHYWTGVSSILGKVSLPLTEYLTSDPSTVLVPVPLHSRRYRERGFNQSMIISRALSYTTGLSVSELLRRTRYTTAQAHLTAAERTTNIIGAFNRGRIAAWPHSVILVDDVITTGSTISECAGVLRNHGVKKITAVALAKG